MEMAKQLALESAQEKHLCATEMAKHLTLEAMTRLNRAVRIYLSLYQLSHMMVWLQPYLP
jgi:hypothetical protein